MGERTWVRNSVRKLAGRLRDKGFPLSSNTVWRFSRHGLLDEDRRRKRRGPTRDPAARDVQFQYIAAQKEKYAAAGLPIISVDAKKKEMDRQLQEQGRAWCKEAPEVSEHGFASEAECVATPYGVYDLTKNRGFVVVGLSGNTPEFAVMAIARWWEVEGRVTYPSADEVLILADGGGGNGSRCRAWKWKLQELFGGPVRPKGDVMPLPAGVTQIQPGRVQVVQPDQHQLGGQTTSVGAVDARVHPRHDDQHRADGAGFSRRGRLQEGHQDLRGDTELLDVRSHEVCPQWNYTLTPRIASCTAR